MIRRKCLQIRSCSLSMMSIQFCYFISYRRSWISLGHQGALTSTYGYTPTTKEGLTFAFYSHVGLYVRLNLP